MRRGTAAGWLTRTIAVVQQDPGITAIAVEGSLALDRRVIT